MYGSLVHGFSHKLAIKMIYTTEFYRLFSTRDNILHQHCMSILVFTISIPDQNLVLWLSVCAFVCFCLYVHGDNNQANQLPDKQRRLLTLPTNSNTRASARRGTNTPCQCHHLMYQNNLNQRQWPLRYKAKSMDDKMLVTWPTYTLGGQSFCHIDPLSKIRHSSNNSLQNIKQNHWTKKSRQLTHITINEVNLCVTLVHYPTYDIHPSNTLKDIRQKSLNHEI